MRPAGWVAAAWSAGVSSSTSAAAVLAWVLLGAAVGWGAPRARAQDASEQRCWAMLRSGRVITSEKPPDLRSGEGQVTMSGVGWFDQDLVRCYYDRERSAELAGPHLVMANGDVLPGRPASEAESARDTAEDDEGAGGAWMRVVVAAPLWTIDLRSSALLRVRREALARVVLVDSGVGLPELRPGTVGYRSGRQVRVRRLRWFATGLRALTDEGVMTASLAELAWVDPPAAERWTRGEAAAQDAWGPAPAAREERLDLLVRATLANGAVVTYRRGMVRSEHRENPGEGHYHIVQPAWAAESLRLPVSQIVGLSYRSRNELPLSSLEVESAQERGLTGFTWSWRADANVRGEPMAAGAMRADLGLGTHAPSTILISLPPYARRLSGWVGIDRSASGGGCVRVSVHRDDASAAPLWRSGFLRGSDAPARFEVDLAGARRVALVTDEAHEGRPAGADPFDVRDITDWLHPLVEVDGVKAAEQAPSRLRPMSWFPQLEGWQLESGDAGRLELTAAQWLDSLGRWPVAMRPLRTGGTREQPRLTLTRRLRVTPANAWLEVWAMHNQDGQDSHRIGLRVNGQRVESLINGDVHPESHGWDQRTWSLGEFAGREVELALDVYARNDPNARSRGVVWGRLQPQPLVVGLPESGDPWTPAVALTTLKPVKADLRGEKEAPRRGLDSQGHALRVRGYPFAEGFAVKAGTTLTYELDPRWRRFVAVVGLADGSSAVGPFELVVDDKTLWRSKNPDRYERTTRPGQIDVAIPAGHKTLTLKVGGDGWAAWAMSGFMVR